MNFDLICSISIFTVDCECKNCPHFNTKILLTLYSKQFIEVSVSFQPYAVVHNMHVVKTHYSIITAGTLSLLQCFPCWLRIGIYHIYTTVSIDVEQSRCLLCHSHFLLNNIHTTTGTKQIKQGKKVKAQGSLLSHVPVVYLLRTFF